jgi:hypothetical protein
MSPRLTTSLRLGRPTNQVGENNEGANEVQLWSIARVALGRDITG